MKRQSLLTAALTTTLIVAGCATAPPYNPFKITEEDWRNRKKWDEYERAVCDMVDRTSTEIAPWTLVEAEDKKYGRIKVLRTIVDRLAQELKR